MNDNDYVEPRLTVNAMKAAGMFCLIVVGAIVLAFSIVGYSIVQERVDRANQENNGLPACENCGW